MQPFQYDLRSSAAQDNSITHAAAAPSNLDAATTMRSASTDSKTPYNYAHTSTPKAAWSHRYTAAKKKRQTDRSRTRRTDEVPFIAGCSHFTRKNTRFRAPASSPKQSPCNIMQPFQCDLQAPSPAATLHGFLPKKHKVSCSGFLPKTAPLQHHAAIPMRSASTDSKTPYNYAHTSTPKAAWSHRYTAAKKKRPTDRSRTRRTDEVPFIVACSHFTRKNTRFRAPASSPQQSPCNIMQPFQCDLQAQIPKHPITTHTQAHPKQLEATVTLRQKKTTNRPQPHPPHRRGTFHRRLQPLYTEKHKVSCSGFLPTTEPLQHHAAIPMRSASTDSKTPYNYAHTSTPKAAWSHRYTAAKKKRPTDRSRTRRTDEVPFIVAGSHFTRKNTRFRAPASSPTHHFPSSPLPIVPTSHRHHFPSSPLPFLTTPLHHHFPSSPLPFVTTSLPHHFPSSPLPFIITSLLHRFPSSPLPFIITSSRSIS